MQQAIFYSLPYEIKTEIRSIRTRPPFCKYPVSFAKCELIPFPDSPMLRQYARDYNFHMQLQEIVVKNRFEAFLSIEFSSVFLFFGLEGGLDIYDADDQWLTSIKENTFFLLYMPKSKYRIEINQGALRIMAVSFRNEWLLSYRQEFDSFKPIFDAILNQNNQAVIMPHCRFRHSISSDIEKVCGYSANNLVERSTGLFCILVRCLNTCHTLLKTRNYLPSIIDNERLHLLLDYLSSYYNTEKVHHISKIASDLHLAEWKVRQIALQHFGIPLRQQIIKTRMCKALELISTRSKTLNETSIIVGYDNYSYFCRSFKKYFGFNPASVIK